jgi:hypothetical protein
MALEGTLKDFSLADIFQLIGLQRKTGVLTLRGKDDTVTVTFLDGKVVGADSLNKRLENRLGTVLVKTGMLSSDQLARALEIQKETLQRLGFILTHYGIISPESLRSAIQLQILQVVYRLFRWKDGDYHFSQETTIEYDRDNVQPITAESILMEGARMIDEWPIIEKRVRSYDLVYRKKLIDQEIIVVDDDDAGVDFDETSHRKKKGAPAGDKIKISETEKSVYDAVDGTLTVSDIIESSRFSEFDTVKAVFELLTRDLIEEVRPDQAAAVASAVEEDFATADVPTVLPLPLIIFLVILAVASLATFYRNPLNSLAPLGGGNSPSEDVQKAISLVRLERVGHAIDSFYVANGALPDGIQELTPHFISSHLLRDPWGKQYTYLPRPEKYLLTGFTPTGQPDTDLLISRSIDSAPAPSSSESTPRGGIRLIE